jgi:hypothetical protein
MFGQATHLGPLKLRKQLLVAESELNRSRLSEDWQAMTHGVRDVTRQAKMIAAWASSAALLVAGVTALRRHPPTAGATKSSWLTKILSLARVASTIWLAFHARGEKEEHK